MLLSRQALTSIKQKAPIAPPKKKLVTGIKDFFSSKKDKTASVSTSPKPKQTKQIKSISGPTESRRVSLPSPLRKAMANNNLEGSPPRPKSSGVGSGPDRQSSAARGSGSGAEEPPVRPQQQATKDPIETTRLARRTLEDAKVESDPRTQANLVSFASVLVDALQRCRDAEISMKEAQKSAVIAQHAAVEARANYDMTSLAVREMGSLMRRMGPSLMRRLTRGSFRSEEE